MEETLIKQPTEINSIFLLRVKRRVEKMLDEFRKYDTGYKLIVTIKIQKG
jgi:hypothetical protein